MPSDPALMYRWRRMTEIERAKILNERQEHGRPSHSLPHFASNETSCYLITAACFEHQPVIGHSPARMSNFEMTLLESLYRTSQRIFAWSVLPNHYHALVDTDQILATLKSLGQLHRRTAFEWNGQESKRGRQVWCNAAETAMKSEGHFYATLNYVLHNPVHHGYVRKWTDWPYSNAREYIAETGRQRASQLWNEYPLYDYGKDWDPPEL